MIQSLCCAKGLLIYQYIFSEILKKGITIFTVILEYGSVRLFHLFSFNKCKVQLSMINEQPLLYLEEP